MTLNFRAALAALVLATAPFAVSAQDDGRAYDVQLADQIATACGGSDADACSALVSAIPANSPLHEVALTTAVNSGMTEAQVTRVASVARITPRQAARVQAAAVTRGFVSAAFASAVQTATQNQGTGTPANAEQEGSPA